MIPIYNARGEHVGDIDNFIYYTKRDYKKGQIFIAPKFKNGLAIDRFILKQLIQHKVQKIVITVLNFEDMSFNVESELDHFLNNSELINFDKKLGHLNITYYSAQRYMPMHLWSRTSQKDSGFIQTTISQCSTPTPSLPLE